MVSARLASALIAVTVLITLFSISYYSGLDEAPQFSILGSCENNLECPTGYECYKYTMYNESGVCVAGYPCDRCPAGRCAITDGEPRRVECLD